MSTLARLNATIPVKLDQYADIRVETGDFGNKSEYIRHLIREGRARHLESDVRLLNQMIQAGRDSSSSDKTAEEFLAGAKKQSKKPASNLAKSLLNKRMKLYHQDLQAIAY